MSQLCRAKPGAHLNLVRLSSIPLKWLSLLCGEGMAIYGWHLHDRQREVHQPQDLPSCRLGAACALSVLFSGEKGQVKPQSSKVVGLQLPVFCLLWIGVCVPSFTCPLLSISQVTGGERGRGQPCPCIPSKLHLHIPLVTHIHHWLRTTALSYD